MLKMVLLAYNEAIEEEVMEALTKCNLKSYTKLAGAFGRGESSGTHLGNDIWPGRNNLLYVACESAKAKELLSYIRVLRGSLGKEGLKAFILPLEEMT
jgi:hypothetical protein